MSDDTTDIHLYLECIGNKAEDNIYHAHKGNCLKKDSKITSSQNKKAKNEIPKQSEDIYEDIGNRIYMKNKTKWKIIKYSSGATGATTMLLITLGLAAYTYLNHANETGRTAYDKHNNQTSCNHFANDTGYESCNGLINDSLVNGSVKHVTQDKIISAELKEKYDTSQLFFQTVKSRNFTATKWLVDNKKVDINSQDEKGRTALHFAAVSNYTQLVNYLIHHNNINVNIKTFKLGLTPLHVAVGAGLMSVVVNLVENNARMNLHILELRYTPLHMAVSYNHFNIVRYLLSKKARVNAVSQGGTTVLQMAVTTQNLKIVKLLLKHQKLKINQMDERLFTAFHYACNTTNLQIVKMLIHYKANINAVTRDGSTGLHIAASNDFADIVYYLLNMGAKITLDKKGNSPKDVADQNNYKSIGLAIQNHNYYRNINYLLGN